MSSMTPKINALRALAARAVEHIPAGGRGGSEVLSSLCMVVSDISDKADKLHQLYGARNPTETDGTHTKRIATAAQKFAAEVQTARERAQELEREGRANLQARIDDKTRLRPDSYATEIRTMFRGLSKDERIRFLDELIEAGTKRGPELAALIDNEVPLCLTGLTEAIRTRYMDTYVAKHATHELLDWQALRDMAELAEVAASTAKKIAIEYTNPANLAEVTAERSDRKQNRARA